MNAPLEPELIEKLNLLRDKYAVMGQDLFSYIDGLLHADYLTYWDYIRLDVLLNLQSPRTPMPDETIFILYHQITELYFKLVLHALEQIRNQQEINAVFIAGQLKRINSYFDALTKSFEIMIDGMNPDQFLKFRMSLLPASGFQSAQYRLIEIASTDFYLLTPPDHRKTLATESDYEIIYQHLYWQRGASELASGKKTLTLKQFEAKYRNMLIEKAIEWKPNNLLQILRKLSQKGQLNDDLTNLFKCFDHNANVAWPLMHLKAATRYLQRNPEDIKATGGTNWQKYLPPRQQRISFFPELFSEQELKDWGIR